MLLAHRTRRRLKIVCLGLVVYASVVLALAVVAPAPNVPFATAYGRWLFRIPATIAVWVALELFTTWALDREFWNRMPNWARVGLLAIVVSAIVVLGLWLHALWQGRGAA